MEEAVTPEVGVVVKIELKEIEQLFNSLDPSPFIEKDLDDDAVEYLLSSFDDYPIKTKIKIVIHLPQNKKGKIKEDEIRNAIRNFFTYKDTLEENNIDQKIKEGQKSMIIGLSFLTVCLVSREFLLTLEDNIIWHMLSEALLIFGWVAMWKPVSNVLYDWWPMKQKQGIYTKISKSEVDFNYY